jgi:hypothetical protein
MRDTKGFKAYMGLLVTLGLLAVVIALLYVEPKTGAKDALLITLGALVSLVKDVYGYYFGSSEGSSRKTEIMEAANVPASQDIPA